MKTLLDEILTLEFAPAAHAPSCDCSRCRGQIARHSAHCHCPQCRRPSRHWEYLDETGFELNGDAGIAAPYERVFPMPVLRDGRKPQITSGHRSVNRSRPNHYGADIMYPYIPGQDPPRKELEYKRRMDRNSSFWTPEDVWAMAFAPGKVTFVKENSLNNGWVVDIMHPDGLRSRYLHLTQPIVKAGDMVKAGDRLAQLDKRGNPAHLHFEIRKKGYYG